MLDYRLVQTAVIGDRNSDLPVILPMDPRELDLWRKAHPSYTYWCGLQLDGCGGELSDRRYTNKVCHFAHHPSAPVCRRTANGESSADHLFIKQGVRRLLDGKNLRGKVETRDLGTGPGDAVDVHLVGSRRRLRFQLSSVDHRAWRRTADELASDGSDVDWILASDGPVSQQIVSRHGYCLRVRCETVGGERRVHIGAEARDRTVIWTPLEDCGLTPSGIVTPRVEEIRLSRPRQKPLAFPIQGGAVFAIVTGVAVPADSPFASEDRHLLVADVKPMDSPISRTLVSLPGDTAAPPADHVYRVSEGARILLGEKSEGWAIEATRYVRLNAHEAQRTGLWTPPQVDHLQPTPAQTDHRRSAPAQVSTPIAKPSAETPVTDMPLNRLELVSALRDVLSRSAGRRATVTWDELARAISPEMSTYSIADRCSLLVEVDRPLRDSVPVLSALIRKGGAPLPYLPRILVQLGVPRSETSPDIARWAQVETDRAFAAHGTPPSAMPPRHRLGSSQGVTRQRQGSGRPRRTAEQQMAVRPSGGNTPPEHVRVRRLRGLVQQLEECVPRLSKPVRSRVRRSISGAQTWLAYHDSAVTPAQRQVLATRIPKHIVRTLEKTLQAARNDVRASKR
ncbi:MULTISPECIES: competence protein CoiA family protein [Streptomyces]|uniref:hypothetical protein n=1 Tax=Streptomyces TaxID=1883 RepID=UPI003414165C